MSVVKIALFLFLIVLMFDVKQDTFKKGLGTILIFLIERSNVIMRGTLGNLL